MRARFSPRTPASAVIAVPKDEMTSRERVLGAIGHEAIDHVPLLCWCFGVRPPEALTWRNDAGPVPYWYSGRLQHLHTLPVAWGIEDDFQRVRAWRALGVDDLVEVSVPWGIDPGVTWRDGCEDDVLVREYDTPDGPLRHAVRRDREEVGPGWPVQPDCVPLLEDFNIPRAVRHACAGPDDLIKLRHLLRPPAAEDRAAYRDRMRRVRVFCSREGVAVQAHAAFGMDAVVWLMGAENAILAAVGEPGFFEELLELVHACDRARVDLALETEGADIVVQRGWYSSTDFWSPTLFRRFLLPRIRELAARTHEAGKRFAYVMTTGVQVLADQLVEAGIDLLYYVDPVQDRVDPAAAKRAFAGRVALAGGVNSSLTLAGGDPAAIAAEVERACHTLGPTGFLLAPVDALFPDTPWRGVEALIEAWRRLR